MEKEPLFRVTIILNDDMTERELRSSRKEIISCYSNNSGEVRDSGDGLFTLVFEAYGKSLYGCLAVGNLELGYKSNIVPFIDTWMIEYHDYPHKDETLVIYVKEKYQDLVQGLPVVLRNREEDLSDEPLYKVTVRLKSELSAEELENARKAVIAGYSNNGGTIDDSGDGSHLLIFATEDEELYGCLAVGDLKVGHQKHLVSDCIESFKIEYRDEPEENCDLLALYKKYSAKESSWWK